MNIAGRIAQEDPRSTHQSIKTEPPKKICRLEGILHEKKDPWRRTLAIGHQAKIRFTTFFELLNEWG
jgi:hypothetical protein